ncbi:GNAT family N-acetyltransferase [Pararhizobium haloflavum]|uniref:GNAT family N-acetyltransferase n=1 Tax=Pararhizobium haloflavum TaxID=2037914 RepID=UPI000C191183|nr:GNAT family protein [Pararhizobium haloflavum]
MFGFLSRRSEPLLIETANAYLRFPERGDFNAWRSLRMASRAFLQPWEPSWSTDELSRLSYLGRVGRYEREYVEGHAIPLFLFMKESDELLGGLTIGYIRRGAAQSCMIGYWMGERHAGQGHMTAALDAVIPHIFQRLKLHRIEAACIPENTRSIRLLEKARFRREGYLRGYLKINGVWRDHLLFARLKDDSADHPDGAGAPVVGMVPGDPDLNGAR